MNASAVPLPAGAPLLRTRDLSVGYGACPLFPALDVALHSGELVCLLGGNGAGKTTLLKTLGGILPPLSGAVTIAGGYSGYIDAGGDADMSSLSPRARARHVALLLAAPELPPFLLGRELVALGRTPHAGWLPAGFKGMREGDEDVVNRVMELLRCGHLAERRLGALSDGERQRLCLARALAQDAPVLLLDEPLAHLDPPAKAELLGLLREWVRAPRSMRGLPGDEERGRVVVAAVHEVDLALGFADRCLLVAPGRDPFLGTPEEAAAEPLRLIFPGWPAFWDPLGLRRGRMGGARGPDSQV